MRSQNQTDAAAELAGMAPIVRPVGNKPEIIAALQRGLSGEVMREAARVR